MDKINKRNLSDYKKPRTDLNELLPTVNRTNVVESLSHNIFNRSFTKNEFDRVVGIIGDGDTTQQEYQIIEPTTFRQHNQLQPVITSRVGDIDWFMTFEEFMERISRLGVSVDDYSSWGKSLQFNWVPPIDIDKIINYKDYYWDTNDFNDRPQYITIKNKCTWAVHRFNESKRVLTDILPNIPIIVFNIITNTISITGNGASLYSTGDTLVLINSNRETIILTISSASFNNSTLNTDIYFNETFDASFDYTHFIQPNITILSFDVSENTIKVMNDNTGIFSPNYVFSLENISLSKSTIVQVEFSTYDETINTTEIKLITQLDNNTVIDFISLMTTINSINSEKKKTCDKLYSLMNNTTLSPAKLGDLIWYDKLLIRDNTQSPVSTTTLGDNFLTDNTVDFLTIGLNIGDFIEILSGPNIGIYNISSIGTNTIEVNGDTFFSDTNIKYRIYSYYDITALETSSSPTSPSLNQLWWDSTNDTLKQYDGSTFIIKVENFSILIGMTNDRRTLEKLFIENQWSTQNKWVHRNQLSTFTGKIQAKIPIIEYHSSVLLSNTSISIKEWKYRKDAQNDYIISTKEPTLFELIDITQSIDEIQFHNSSTILINEKYGNISQSLKNGDKIKFQGFNVNDGEYSINSIDFIQFTPNARFQSVIYINENIPNLLDIPIGAKIIPSTTSHGDTNVGISENHWEFNGIKEIIASSIDPVPNPMLDVEISSSSSTSYESKLGLVWEEFSFNTDGNVNPIIPLDDSLHDLCLFEDYQEGDIRIYFNGERQYGNYVDIQSSIDSEFIGSIQLLRIVNKDDKIRIELGEYSSRDIGKRAIVLNLPSSIDKYNLVDIRKVEQHKTEINQYPLFKIYDIEKNPKQFSNSIFKFTEDEKAIIDINILKRIVADDQRRDYSFENELYDGKTKEIFAYYDVDYIGDEYQTIWKHGTNYEEFKPEKVDGEWVLPNQLYYNVNHENTTTIKLTEMFRHFKSIISNQPSNAIFNDTSNVFYLNESINFGLGGTIKEHNDGFDSLLSSLFVNNVNPISLIEFAHEQYISQQQFIKELIRNQPENILIDNIAMNVSELHDNVANRVKNIFEINDKMDEWFGDSTSHILNTNIGVKNWIATPTIMGFFDPVTPYIIEDIELSLLELVHHDGHRSPISFEQAEKEVIIKQLLTYERSVEQQIIDIIDPFPNIINNAPIQNGDITLRTNTSDKTRKVYRFNSTGTWEEIEFNKILINALLEIERALYDISKMNTANHMFNFNDILSEPKYDELHKLQFNNFYKENNIEQPLNSTNYFKQNDPFTWNYAYSDISTHPITGLPYSNSMGSWQGLYESIYNTPYPHREPWKLQEYQDKPTWWDDEYLDNVRYWKSIMWSNILSGTVPLGRMLPSGTSSSGTIGEIVTIYSYIPVNIENTDTVDGILPDGLLPPLWNSSNSQNISVRSLYDADNQDVVRTPSASYEFNQKGINEWNWLSASQRIYDDLIISFKLQPMKFIHMLFGFELTTISCLEVDKTTHSIPNHEKVKFHGDLEDGEINKINGLNQWYIHYNRFNGFDGISSEFRTLWKEWKSPISYLFGAFIDTKNFIIHNDNFDITNKDYNIAFKKSYGMRNIYIDSLVATTLTVPSKYSPLRDNGNGWTVEIDTINKKCVPFEFYEPENFQFEIVDGSNELFRLSTYKISGADIVDANGFQIVNYGQSLLQSTITSLLDDMTAYSASILIDGINTVNVSIVGQESQTIQEAIININAQLGVLGTAYLKQGNIIIQSDSVGGSSTIQITDMGLFASINASFVSMSPSQTAAIEFEGKFYIDGNVTSTFKENTQIIINDSTNFNGVYTIKSIRYDIRYIRTEIEITEQITPVNMLVDGIIEPVISRTFPNSWVDGTEVYLNSSGTLSDEIDGELPYYIIRVNDREFKLADTRTLALNNVPLIFNGSIGVGYKHVGRLEYTFNILNQEQTTVAWRRYFSDTREITQINGSIVISGIQNIIDFIVGYENYHDVLGFKFANPDIDNVDNNTGRKNDWQLEIEKFIEKLYLSRSIGQDNQIKYSISFDNNSDSFTIHDSNVTWQNATRILLIENEGSKLPASLSNSLHESIPYHIIRGTNNKTFQLAVSQIDAKKGNYITISDDGIGDFDVILYNEVGNSPRHEINPFKNNIWIEQGTGILSNIFDGAKLDNITKQHIYNNFGEIIYNDKIIVNRRDKRTKISLVLSEQSKNEKDYIISNNNEEYMSGMHAYFDGYEHIIQFSDYSTDESLIYNGFLGLNTPNFKLEFNRQDDFTLRPNVGGSILHGSDQIQNMEGAIDEMRNYYSTFASLEGNIPTDLVRDSLGYNNELKFMDNLQINPKSQFLFWRGMIQNKGTNFSIDAFTNQSIFNSANVDEFWAYKLGCFGDSKEKIYPEMKLYTRDVVRTEMRVEFVEPSGGLLDNTFDIVKLTDKERWWNQPDQLEKFSPRQSFYFDIDVIEIINNAENHIIVVNGKFILQLGSIGDYVIITHDDIMTGEKIVLVNGVDYEFMSLKYVRFNITDATSSIVDPTMLNNVTVSIISYNYDAQNPAKVIDKISGPVVTNVPLWNPLFGQYYHNAYSVITYRDDIDPARYNVTQDTSGNGKSIWTDIHIGDVWFDSSKEGYLPYNDPSIYPDINDRIFNWGVLAEWADIELYEWVESNMHPGEYAKVSKLHENEVLTDEEKKLTGHPYTKLYKNVALDIVNDLPIWVEENTTREEFIAGAVDITNTTSFGGIVDIYINGKFNISLSISPLIFLIYCMTLPSESYVYLIKRAHVPSDDEIGENAYIYSTPYVSVNRYDEIAENSSKLYYFWVRNKKTVSNNTTEKNITIYEAEKHMKNMPHPYMILQGIKTPDYGYGLIYGNIFDEFKYDLPYRYTQMVIKNLEGTVKDNDRYSLRFTRDFTLRDRMPISDDFKNDLSLKNVHWEWKLIREKQLFKIDKNLWDKITESLLGYKYENDIEYNTIALPTLNRVLYDDIYNTDTRYGTGKEQILLPAEMAVDTISGILNDTNIDFSPINIDDFLNDYNLETYTDIIETMRYIYDNFSISNVNYIFFQILHDAFSVKHEVEDFFKTSWVGVSISQNILPPRNIDIGNVKLYNGTKCTETQTTPINGGH